MPTPTVQNTKIAQFTIRGRQVDKGTFPAMKALERNYKQAGYPANVMHVGYAPHFKGISYCKKCNDMVYRPYVYNYNGHEYYRCAICETINYVN